MIKILTAILSIVIVIAIGIGYLAYRKTHEEAVPTAPSVVSQTAPLPASPPAPDTSELPDAATTPVPVESAVPTSTTKVSLAGNQKNQLKLSIIADKSYALRQDTSGIKYAVNYDGPSFNAVIVKKLRFFAPLSASAMSSTTLAQSQSFYTSTMEMRKIASGGFESRFDAVTPAGSATSSNTVTRAEVFYQTGTFALTVDVYKCSDLSPADTCIPMPVSRFELEKKVPLQSASKNITVLPPAIPDGKTVLDCDYRNDASCTQDFLDVFQANLEACKPSSGTTPIGLEVFMGTFRKYEILGIKDGLCSINFSLIPIKEAKPAIAALAGQVMNCRYGITERTINAVASMKNCTGELAESIAKLPQ